jgi:hypothetical protein
MCVRCVVCMWRRALCSVRSVCVCMRSYVYVLCVVCMWRRALCSVSSVCLCVIRVCVFGVLCVCGEQRGSVCK